MLKTLSFWKSLSIKHIVWFQSPSRVSTAPAVSCHIANLHLPGCSQDNSECGATAGHCHTRCGPHGSFLLAFLGAWHLNSWGPFWCLHVQYKASVLADLKTAGPRNEWRWECVLPRSWIPRGVSSLSSMTRVPWPWWMEQAGFAEGSCVLCGVELAAPLGQPVHWGCVSSCSQFTSPPGSLRLQPFARSSGPWF